MLSSLCPLHVCKRRGWNNWNRQGVKWSSSERTGRSSQRAPNGRPYPCSFGFWISRDTILEDKRLLHPEQQMMLGVVVTRDAHRLLEPGNMNESAFSMAFLSCNPFFLFYNIFLSAEFQPNMWTGLVSEALLPPTIRTSPYLQREVQGLIKNQLRTIHCFLPVRTVTKITIRRQHLLFWRWWKGCRWNEAEWVEFFPWLSSATNSCFAISSLHKTQVLWLTWTRHWSMAASPLPALLCSKHKYVSVFQR